MRISPVRILIWLAVLAVTRAALAQDAPSVSDAYDAWQPARPNNAVCSEPSAPQAVHAAVDRCVDSLVRSDLEHELGILRDDAVVPDDPDLPNSPDMKPFTTRAGTTGASSWAPMALRRQKPQAASQSQGATDPFVLRLPSSASLSNTTDIDETLPSESVPPSTIAQGLARARHQREVARTQRHLTLPDTTQDQVCRQLHLSQLECRLKLKDQKVAATSHCTDAVSTSRQKHTH